ncbi:hypothetical protein C2S53_006955 [Perilla frutescens var. hirtella]|uniref:Late embryogenesis abundant protein LEA-2 subgroup domain-containing protein n=1 Tax=Perilla frutescens var. hirtella TaxID=608512 RepID=A0AAD4P308_PERFH|nr:hypothetical protein C2S53_006955 [Perilla frutescens var. hirtella]
MAEKIEQEKPLAPGIHSIIVVDKRSHFPAEFISPRRRLCLKCCGCSTALLLILVVTILVLMITVFRVKDPTLKLNSLKIDGLDLLSNKTNGMIKGGLNLTMEADVSIKNPNVASFKFDEAEMEVLYNGTVVGEGRTPAGEAEARRTRRLSVWIVVMVDRLVGVKPFDSDFAAGSLAISTFTRMSGMVNIADVIKKSVVVKLNCTMNLNFTSQAIQDRNCRRN